MVDAYLKKQFDDDRRETRKNKRRQFFSDTFSSMKKGTSSALSNVKTGYAKIRDSDAYKKASKFAVNYELQERKKGRKKSGKVTDHFAGFGGYEGYANDPLGNGKGRKKSGKVTDHFAGFGGYEGYANDPLGNGNGRKKSGKHSYWF